MPGLALNQQTSSKHGLYDICILESLEQQNEMPMTDEDAALEAISTLDPLSQAQQEAKARIDSILGKDGPFVDIHELFELYSVLYFRSLLVRRVDVSWSPRLTLCAGICELVRDPENGNKYSKTRLKLSEPLLKYRPRSDVVNTLLHEAIHAYLFIATSWRHARGDDGTGHGAGFLLLADAINDHGGYHVTVFHTFHDEVDSYRTHVWQCDGPCRLQAPLFGLVKRSMNRTPGRIDVWWRQHEEVCGGTYHKIAEPDMTREQVERLSGLKRAGRQRNKIDAWISGRGDEERKAGKDAVLEQGDVPTKRSHSDSSSEGETKRRRLAVDCPICGANTAESEINEHIDLVHSP